MSSGEPEIWAAGPGGGGGGARGYSAGSDYSSAYGTRGSAVVCLLAGLTAWGVGGLWGCWWRPPLDAAGCGGVDSPAAVAPPASD